MLVKTVNAYGHGNVLILLIGFEISKRNISNSERFHILWDWINLKASQWNSDLSKKKKKKILVNTDKNVTDLSWQGDQGLGNKM